MPTTEDLNTEPARCLAYHPSARFGDYNEPFVCTLPFGHTADHVDEARANIRWGGPPTPRRNRRHVLERRVVIVVGRRCQWNAIEKS